MRHNRIRPKTTILASLVAAVGLEEAATVDARTPRIKLRHKRRTYGQGRSFNSSKSGPGRKHGCGMGKKPRKVLLPAPTHAIDCEKNARLAADPKALCNCFRERPNLSRDNSMRVIPAWSHPDYRKFAAAAGVAP
jgi:hypothetical protein